MKKFLPCTIQYALLATCAVFLCAQAWTQGNPAAPDRPQAGPFGDTERSPQTAGSHMPDAGPLDFPTTVRHGLWLLTSGTITSSGQRLTLTSPAGKDGFARLRGSEDFRNLLCRVKVAPATNGPALIYLRYHDDNSFVRLQVTTDQVTVLEKNGTASTTLLRVPLPRDQIGPVDLDCSVNNNRLLLRVDGKAASPRPIALTADAKGGGFALGTAGGRDARQASFADLHVSAVPARWVQAATDADTPREVIPMLPGMLLPAASLTAGTAGYAARSLAPDARAVPLPRQLQQASL